jgi:hypothetical protein
VRCVRVDGGEEEKEEGRGEERVEQVDRREGKEGSMNYGIEEWGKCRRRVVGYGFDNGDDDDDDDDDAD